MRIILLDWNERALTGIRESKPGPPMAARSIGILYTCIYDAWAAYDAIARPVHSSTPRRPGAQRTDANRTLAIHYAAYRALLDQFPKQKKLFADYMVELGLNPNDASTNLNSPIGVGNVAAKAVLDFRHADNSNQENEYSDTTNYSPKNKSISALFPTTLVEIASLGKWQPLSYLSSDKVPSEPNFIAPHWYLVKPFALTSGSQFRPPAPVDPYSQIFMDQAKHVIDIQANMNTKQKVIAEYWADGPKSELPPGHWTLFTSYVVKRDKLNLDQSVKLFFAVANAIFDASIATWEAKVHFDYVRPITAIRALFRDKTIKAWGGPGKGIVEIDGATWLPFQASTFPTPPFAEYTSGHSAFSMAAAEVLKSFTGSDLFGYYYMQDKPLNADPTEYVLGTTMRWNTFSEAAYEAGESRIYGGIHFYEGNVRGLELGQKVGAAVFEKAQSYWEGTI